MRDKVGVTGQAGYPNYPPADANGYPPSIDVSKRLAMFYGSTPDYYETLKPKLDGPFVPAVKDADGNVVANPRYKESPGAILHGANLPVTGSRAVDQGVHTADDGVLTAIGPGSEQFKGFMDNTEVFRVIVDSLGLGSGQAAHQTKVQQKAPANAMAKTSVNPSEPR